MTSVKRKIVAIVSAALMAGTMAVGASAYTTYYPSTSIAGDIQGNPMTVSASSVGTYSNAVDYANYTKVNTTTAGQNAGYNGSYKKAEFKVYSYSNGSFTLITSDSKTKTGTSSSIQTTSVTPSYSWARRVQVGWLHFTSSSNSPIVEKHYCRITKAGL